jgi:hypothetical protein
MHMHIKSCMYLCVHLSYRSSFQYEEKTFCLWLFSLTFCLTWCSPVLSIYLQTKFHSSVWLNNVPLCIYTIFLIHSLVLVHLGCSQSLSCVNNAAINMVSKWLYCILVHIPLVICPGVVGLNPMVFLFLGFWGT